MRLVELHAMRRLGVDPGSVRVGLSLSDEGGVLASPLRTLKRESAGQVVRAIAEAARNAGAGEIVMGLPLQMDGSEGSAARRARELALAVERAAGVPVVLWDERLTTVGAEAALRSAGVKGRERRARIDQAAAVVLLQSYLDSKRGTAWHGGSDGDDL